MFQQRSKSVSRLLLSSNSLSSYKATSGLKFELHTSSLCKSNAEKCLNGINDCPYNCLCSRDIKLDYKNARLLSQFVSNQTGMILPRTITKLCMSKQRKLALEIRRARKMGFIPFTHKMPQYLKDPSLF